MRAEKQQQQAAKRQQVVGHDEVLNALDVADARYHDAGKHVEAQQARQAQEEKQDAVDRAGLLTRRAPLVHREAHDVLEDGHNGAERGKAHEQEEKRAPKLAEWHLLKNAGKRDEHQARAAARLDAKGEASGEDDEAGHERDEGIDAGDAYGLARKRAVLAQVAAENQHAARTDGQREERLAHGGVHGVHGVAQTLAEELVKVRQQVESETVHAAGQGDRAHAQHEHDDEQRAHHDLRDALHTLLQAQAANEHAEHHDDGHVHEHLAGVGEQGVEDLAALFRCDARELPGCALHHEGEHPAGNGGVEHHEQVVADQAKPLDAVPLSTLGLERVVAAGDALLAGAAGGELHHQNRQAEDEKEHQVHEDERAATVLTGDIGEAPDVAQADGAACAHQDEAEPRGELLALGDGGVFFHSWSPLRAWAPLD